MARFLITSWPFPGHLYPQIALAHALRARGQEVAIYTGKQSAGLLAAEQFLHFPFQALDEKEIEAKLFSPSNPFSEPGSGTRFTRLLKEWMVDTIPAQMRDLETVLGEFQPNVICCDQAMWAPLHILHGQGRVPVAISAFCPCCMIPGPDAPPFGLGLPKPRDIKTRFLANAATAAQWVVGRSFRRALNDVRAQYGLPALHTTALAYLREIPLYLIPGTPEWDYDRHDLPSSVRYVGAYLWNKPSTASSPEWFAFVRGDRPWIHVTEGTIHLREPFVLRAAAQGLANSDVEVLMTSGNARDPETIDLGIAAPNLHLARWISHADLLPRIAVLITTGGAGTVLAAIQARVPMILVPTEWDKPEIAQRTVESGAGIRISPSRVTPARIRQAVDTIINNASYKQAVDRVADNFAQYGGADAAAQLLENFAAESRPRHFVAET